MVVHWCIPVGSCRFLVGFFNIFSKYSWLFSMQAQPCTSQYTINRAVCSVGLSEEELQGVLGSLVLFALWGWSLRGPGKLGLKGWSWGLQPWGVCFFFFFGGVYVRNQMEGKKNMRIILGFMFWFFMQSTEWVKLFQMMFSMESRNMEMVRVQAQGLAVGVGIPRKESAAKDFFATWGVRGLQCGVRWGGRMLWSGYSKQLTVLATCWEEPLIKT